MTTTVISGLFSSVTKMQSSPSPRRRQINPTSSLSSLMTSDTVIPACMVADRVVECRRRPWIVWRTNGSPSFVLDCNLQSFSVSIEAVCRETLQLVDCSRSQPHRSVGRYVLRHLVRSCGVARSECLRGEQSASYWPSCSLIASWIFCFTASRLNVAGACIGG